MRRFLCYGTRGARTCPEAYLARHPRGVGETRGCGGRGTEIWLQMRSPEDWRIERLGRERGGRVAGEFGLGAGGGGARPGGRRLEPKAGGCLGSEGGQDLRLTFGSGRDERMIGAKKWNPERAWGESGAAERRGLIFLLLEERLVSAAFSVTDLHFFGLTVRLSFPEK